MGSQRVRHNWATFTFSPRWKIDLFPFHGSVIQLKQEVMVITHTLPCLAGWKFLGSGSNSYKSKSWDYVMDLKWQKVPVGGTLPSEMYKGTTIKFLLDRQDDHPSISELYLWSRETVQVFFFPHPFRQYRMARLFNAWQQDQVLAPVGWTL